MGSGFAFGGAVVLDRNLLRYAGTFAIYPRFSQNGGGAAARPADLLGSDLHIACRTLAVDQVLVGFGDGNSLGVGAINWIRRGSHRGNRGGLFISLHLIHPTPIFEARTCFGDSSHAKRQNKKRSVLVHGTRKEGFHGGSGFKF